MSTPVLTFLGSQPAMKLIRSLLLAPQPRHLRDLAARCQLSPAGVSDLLRRLKEAGALRESRRGNRRCFSLAVDPGERESLRIFFKALEYRALERRAPRFSARAKRQLEWMDEAERFYRSVKRTRDDAP